MEQGRHTLRSISDPVTPQKTTVIYGLGHQLHTLTAVPRFTQPSTPTGW